MSTAKRDDNFVTTLLGLSSTDGKTPVTIYADPTTHRLLVDTAAGYTNLTQFVNQTPWRLFYSDGAGAVQELALGAIGTTLTSGGASAVPTWSSAGAGTVTSVSVTTANGVSGSVATATSTPAITLTLGSITPSAVQVSGLTASQILSTDASKNLTSLDVATYPSLTELSYIKGVTSALQTQINAKGAGTVTAVSVATANGVSGSSSGGATPALTIALGAITPSTVNGNTITTGTGTLTLGTAKTLTVSNSITLAGTDATTMTFPTTSATLARTDAANTFTGTQTIGALVATTVNGNTITTGSSTFTGTAAQTYTFPATSATVGGLGIAQIWTAQNKFNNIVDVSNAITASGNAATVPVTYRLNTVTNNSAATLTITMTTTSAVDGQMTIVRIYDFSAAAQTITWVNTENSTATAPVLSNGSTTLPITAGFMYNSATSKWRCIASA